MATFPHRQMLIFCLTLSTTLLIAQNVKPVFDEAFFKGSPEAIAQACADQALHLKPKKDRVLAQVGRIELAIGNRPKAEECFRAALPGDSESVRWMMQGWLESGEPQKAIQLASSMPLDGWLAKNEMRKGAVLLMDYEHPKEAEMLMRRAYEMDYHNWENIVTYARACVRNQRMDLAGAWFARAVEKGQKDSQFWMETALSLSDHGVER